MTTMQVKAQRKKRSDTGKAKPRAVPAYMTPEEVKTCLNCPLDVCTAKVGGCPLLELWK